MHIKSSAPTRISLLGSGTDLDIFSKEYGGSVLSFTINIRVENSFQFGLPSPVKNIFPYPCDTGLYERILKAYALQENLFTYSVFEGQIGAGLGTSGAFSVSLVSAIERYRGNKLTPYQIAEKAYNMEVALYGKYGGRQDHYAAAFGGLNYILFEDTIAVLSQSRRIINFIYPYMALFFTGTTRKSEKIQEQYKTLSAKKIEQLTNIRELVSYGFRACEKKQIKAFANALNQTWYLKSKGENVTNSRINTIYEAGKEAGALAGKLLGAGGGGYFLFLVEPLKREQLCKKMEEIGVKYVDFEPDMTGVSTRIL